MQLLETLEDKNTLKAKELDKALDELNKRYSDVAKKCNVTASAVYQWCNVSNNIPKRHRKKVIKALIKWREEAEEEKDEPQVSPKEVSKGDGEKEESQKESSDKEKETPEEKAEKKKEEVKNREPRKSEVRRARDELGVTQRFVSSAIDMHTGTYGNKENVRDSKNSFNAEERERISIVFNRLREIEDGKLFDNDVKADEDESTFEDLIEALDIIAKNIKTISNKIIRRHTLGLLNTVRRELKSLIENKG